MEKTSSIWPNLYPSEIGFIGLKQKNSDSVSVRVANLQHNRQCLVWLQYQVFS